MSQPQFIMNNGMWMTFDEIVNDLEVRMSLADKKQLANMDKADLIGMHHGFGTWIRNSYGLWADNPITANWRVNPSAHLVKDPSGIEIDEHPDHPDAVSTRIIEEFWSRVQYLRKP